MTESIPLASIRIDGGTQMRAVLNDDTVAEYAHTIRDGTDFPPITLFFDGSSWWLADGFHRFHAYRAAGAETIEADVRQGTKRDAILFSVGANAQHGLKRTNDDKRKAVETLLSDVEWAVWSDREIARRAGVSNQFVSNLRGKADLSVNDGQMQTDRTVSRGGSTYQQNTANIGRQSGDRAAAQASNDAFRDQHRAQLPDAIVQAQEARQEARQGAKPSETIGLPPEDRIAELEAENASLLTEVTNLRAEVMQFSEMKAEFEKGGFAEVIAGKDEVIRSQGITIENESREKVKAQRSADFWRKKAHDLGHSSDLVLEVGA